MNISIDRSKMSADQKKHHENMRRTDEANTEGRRQQIVHAAITCFNRSGLHGASIGQICKEAGVSPGHLYYYFENKEALVQAVFSHDWDIGQRYLDSLVGTPDSLAIYLELMPSKGTLPQPDGSANLAFVLDVLAEVSRNPAIAEVNKAHRKQYLKKLTEIVEAAQLRGELTPGASIGAVVFAVDLIATARNVAKAANRHVADVYAKHATDLLRGMLSSAARDECFPNASQPSH